MRYKILGLISAVALVAACETAPKSGASAGGGGPAETYTTPLSGGPASVRPGSQEDLVVNVGDRVYFGFDKYNLKGDARATLERKQCSRPCWRLLAERAGVASPSGGA